MSKPSSSSHPRRPHVRLRESGRLNTGTLKSPNDKVSESPHLNLPLPPNSPGLHTPPQGLASHSPPLPGHRPDDLHHPHHDLPPPPPPGLFDRHRSPQREERAPTPYHQAPELELRMPPPDSSPNGTGTLSLPLNKSHTHHHNNQGPEGRSTLIKIRTKQGGGTKFTALKNGMQRTDDDATRGHLLIPSVLPPPQVTASPEEPEEGGLGEFAPPLGWGGPLRRRGQASGIHTSSYGPLPGFDWAGSWLLPDPAKVKARILGLYLNKAIDVGTQARMFNIFVVLHSLQRGSFIAETELEDFAQGFSRKLFDLSDTGENGLLSYIHMYPGKFSREQLLEGDGATGLLPISIKYIPAVHLSSVDQPQHNHHAPLTGDVHSFFLTLISAAELKMKSLIRLAGQRRRTPNPLMSAYSVGLDNEEFKEAGVIPLRAENWQDFSQKQPNASSQTTSKGSVSMVDKTERSPSPIITLLASIVYHFLDVRMLLDFSKERMRDKKSQSTHLPKVDSDELAMFIGSGRSTGV
eukprot:GHVN01092267.1.p1 GENE.GHVN01092267.1~~GHVN01092267.1.p1  ORF type:complete len:598 (-),score=139.76 GHVN01092267.1:46-1608(-)